jgi:hydroxyacylglutathione hydrolase
MLFDSLEKIKKLPSHTKIYPGHGAGSPCGKNISKGDVCNLETQLKSNYALQFHTKEEFAREVLHGMPNPPQYFFNVIAKNKH